MLWQDVDVVVVGGGPAGMAAAVGAWQPGLRVVLLERHGFLGGQAVASLVGTVCGLYHRSGDNAPRYAVSGFARAWADKLGQACQSEPFDVGAGLWVLPYEPWALRRLADGTVGLGKGLQVALHASVSAVSLSAEQAVVRAQVGYEEIGFRATSLVDASGDALAIRLAGRPTCDLSHTQEAAVLFRLAAASDGLKSRGARLAAQRALSRMAASGQLSEACGTVSWVPSHFAGDHVTVKAVVRGAHNADGHGHWNRLTALEMEGREVVDEILGFLRTQAPGFGDARLLEVGCQVGVRLSRCAAGQYVLREDDVLSCRRFSDGIARGAWPVEQWQTRARPVLKHLPEGQTYEVPLRSLRVADFDNAFVAGRCLSAEAGALASARVIGIALQTGWAAGMAAAFRAQQRSDDELIALLRAAQVEPNDSQPDLR